jgi:hypothetical protein
MCVKEPSSHSKSKVQRITTLSPLTNTGLTHVDCTDLARASTLRSCATCASRPTLGGAPFSCIEEGGVELFERFRVRVLLDASDEAFEGLGAGHVLPSGDQVKMPTAGERLAEGAVHVNVERGG